MSRGGSFLEPPTHAISGELRYLTPLWVKVNRDRSDSIAYLEHVADRTDQDHQILHDKIVAVLKRFAFREQHVLVQFWYPRDVGKRQLLTTVDQPFGLGKVDEYLWSYRRDSESKSFVVDEDHEEENRSPAARVFKRGLPEWTCDLDNCTPENFPQKECANHCNLHGYLGLPVFDLNTRLCFGVLELLTSTKYTSYAYEVQRIHKALETVGLSTQKAFDSPFLNVPNERRQKDSNKIYNILKNLCDIYKLPLAQTWSISQHASYVARENVIEKSCSSFETRCVGKECMSRAALPYYVLDMRMWSFFKASTEQHLEKSHGLVGKALLTRGSYFCEDVTRLDEEEYPLVHNARMSGLTGCFAIFLRSVESGDEYVLELYLPSDMKEIIHVLNLVQTLKQKFEIASGFELGDSSSIQVVGPPAEDGIPLYLDHSGVIQISSTKTPESNISDMVASDAVSMVSNQWPSKKIQTDVIRHDLNVVGTSTNVNMMSYKDVSMQKKKDNINDAGEQSNNLTHVRKRKAESLTMEAVEKLVERPIDQPVRSICVNESTLMRALTSSPLQKQSKTTTHFTDINLSQKSLPMKSLQTRSNMRFGVFFVVFLMVRVKRWSCLSKSHGYSGKWWNCGLHKSLPFETNFIYQTARLMIRLNRWKNKISERKKLLNSNLHAVSESTTKPKYTTNVINIAESSLVHASPKQTANNISDTKTVTVKATYKNDMIKFQFSTTSGLSELQHQVARRITKLKSKRLYLKYIDEENDLILLACDADLQNLLQLTANGGTIKLIILTADS